MEINDRDFFKDPFNKDEILQLLNDKPASEMFNFKSPGFKKVGIDRNKLTDSKLIELMVTEPRLIRRPVVRFGGTVYFGADRKVLENLMP
jgi:arsenate reductase (glutaredoxin)